MRVELNKNRSAAAVKAFLNQKEAAQHLGISTVTLRRAVRSGLIPCKRIGARVLFSVQALNTWGAQ